MEDSFYEIEFEVVCLEENSGRIYLFPFRARLSGEWVQPTHRELFLVNITDLKDELERVYAGRARSPKEINELRDRLRYKRTKKL